MNKAPIPSLQVRKQNLRSGDPKICVSITDRLQEDILSSCRDIIRERADIVEWRVDFYKDYNNDFMVEDTLSELRELLKDIPLIFTIRTAEEGGRVTIKLWDYIRIYRSAAKTGLVDLFDIEFNIMHQLNREVIADIRKYAKIIVSKHNFNGTPGYDALIDDIIRLQVAGGDIAKLAVMPSEEGDVERVIGASKEILAHYRTTPFITISMGAMGVATRTNCFDTGSCMTFGAVGRASAPGQLTVRELREALEINRVSFVKSHRRNKGTL